MKKKLLIAAAAVIVIAAAALILFSRSRYGWNIAKKYKAYLDYTFDGNYTLTKGEQGKDGLFKGFTNWTLEFDDGSGKTHKHRQGFTNFVGSYKENYSDAKSMNDNGVFLLVGEAAACKAEREFCESILSKYLTVYPDEYDSWECDEVDISIISMPYLCMCDYNDKEIYKRLDPKYGFKYTETGLKEFVCNFDMYFIFSMQIPVGADTEKYTRIFHEVMDDFVEYTGNPLNYSFMLRERVLDEDGKEVTNLLEKHYVIDGEQYIQGEGDVKAKEALRQKYNEVYDLK